MIYNTSGTCLSNPQASIDSKTKEQIEALEKLTKEINLHLNELDTDFDAHVEQSDQAFVDLTYDVNENTQHLADVDLEQLNTANKLEALKSEVVTGKVDATTVLADGFGITSPDDPSVILPVKFYKSFDTSKTGDFICNLTGKQTVIIRGWNGGTDYAVIKYADSNNWIALSSINSLGVFERRLTINADGDLKFDFSSIPTYIPPLDGDIFVIGQAPSPIEVNPEAETIDIREGITTKGNIARYSTQEFYATDIRSETNNTKTLTANDADIGDLNIRSKLEIQGPSGQLKTPQINAKSAWISNTFSTDTYKQFPHTVDIIATDETKLTYIKIPEFYGKIVLQLTATYPDKKFNMLLERLKDADTIEIDYKKYTVDALSRIERTKDGDIYLVTKGGGTLSYYLDLNNTDNPVFDITVYPNVPPYTNDEVLAFYETTTLEHKVLMGDGSGLTGLYVVGGLGGSTLDFGGDLAYDNLTITNNLSVGASTTTTDLSVADKATLNHVNAVDAQFDSLDITGQTIAKDLIVTGDTHGEEATFNNVNTTNFNGKATTDIFEDDGITVKKAANDSDNNPINTTYSKATNLSNGRGEGSVQQRGTKAYGKYSHTEGGAGGGKSWSRQCTVNGDVVSSWKSWMGQTELPNVSVGDTIFIGTETQSYKVTEVVTQQEHTGGGAYAWFDIHLDKASSSTGLQTIYDIKDLTAYGACSHAEGIATTANGDASHAEGKATSTAGHYAHSEGHDTSASGTASHSEGSNTTAEREGAHAEGDSTRASGSFSHAEGGSTQALAEYSHSEGAHTKAEAVASHAEGQDTTSSGNFSHSEGKLAKAISECAHAEGATTIAGIDNTVPGQQNWNCQHAEGFMTTASGDCSHAEGCQCQAKGAYSHAEGQGTVASGACSHAGGYQTRAVANYQTVIGVWNKPNADIPFIVGDGTNEQDRRNALELDWVGNLKIRGTLSQGVQTMSAYNTGVTV